MRNIFLVGEMGTCAPIHSTAGHSECIGGHDKCVGNHDDMCIGAPCNDLHILAYPRYMNILLKYASGCAFLETNIYLGANYNNRSKAITVRYTVHSNWGKNVLAAYFFKETCLVANYKHKIKEHSVKKHSKL